MKDLLLKKTIVVTGLLLGVSAAWITLVSVTLVTVVDLAVSPSPRSKAPAVTVTAPSPESPAAKRISPTNSPPPRGTTPNG